MSYRLPNRNTTNDVLVYLDAWQDLAEDVVRAFASMGIDGEVYAYNPDFAFRVKDARSLIWSIPVHVAYRIAIKHELAHDADFTKLVRLTIDSGLASREDFIKRFALSRPSINRWYTGKSQGHPAVRPDVCEFIRSKL